jgi:hypothetical protein
MSRHPRLPLVWQHVTLDAVALDARNDDILAVPASWHNVIARRLKLRMEFLHQPLAIRARLAVKTAAECAGCLRHNGQRFIK